jgi:trans-aconitate 2-methyltransferase
MYLDVEILLEGRHMATWHPQTYLRYADERSRPFHELVARVPRDDAARVVDLGCGPGQLTASLTRRWPGAEVVGVDSSAEMVQAAAPYANAQVRFEHADIRRWRAAEPVDVIVANAALQWVPEHRAQLARLVGMLSSGGVLAFQVPGNHGEPSHLLLRELARDPRFAAATAGLERPVAHDALTYLGDLTALGCAVDAWETTYLHVLDGDDPVFGWISGTGARPVLQALDPEQRAVFEAEYKTMLREAYPRRPFGTVLPFRRVFVVARRAA